MVHDKMREANRFKEYERIPKNRIGGDYWIHTGQFVICCTIEDIWLRGDKLVLLGFFTVEPKFYKEKHVLEWKEQAKMCMRFQKDIQRAHTWNPYPAPLQSPGYHHWQGFCRLPPDLRRKTELCQCRLHPLLPDISKIFPDSTGVERIAVRYDTTSSGVSGVNLGLENLHPLFCKLRTFQLHGSVLPFYPKTLNRKLLQYCLSSPDWDDLAPNISLFLLKKYVLPVFFSIH